VRIVVLGDTHIPDHARALPAGLAPHLKRADLILHAGDVTARSVLDELARFAPVQVALGNNDRPEIAAWGAEEEVRLTVEDVEMAMVHDSGPRPGRDGRLRRRFPGARLIIFGHSHIPIDAENEGVRLFNPGSPTWKRRQPFPTFGLIDVTGGRIRTRLVELPATAATTRRPSC
jgi:putative phosphoesterase